MSRDDRRHWLSVQVLENLQAAFLRSGLSYTEVARRMNWHRPDQDRVVRALGFRSYTKSRKSPSGEPYPRTFITYDLACRLAEAIGVAPVDIGI